MTDRPVVDLIVATPNAEALDQTMQGLGAAVVDGSWNGETCDVRCFGNHDFIAFAIKSQGYGEVRGQKDVT